MSPSWSVQAAVPDVKTAGAAPSVCQCICPSIYPSIATDVNTLHTDLKKGSSECLFCVSHLLHICSVPVLIFGFDPLINFRVCAPT